MKKLIIILLLLFAFPVYAETVNTNIGTRTSEEGTINTATGNDAGIFTLTLDADPSGNIDVYDKIVDSASNSYWITAISSNILTVEDRLSGFTTPATALFQSVRVYQTMTLWEADLDNLNLYSSSADAIGNVYNDSTYDESVTINGGATIPLDSITLTVPSGERHDGTAGNGARIVRSGSVAGYVIDYDPTADISGKIEWLEIDGNGNQIGDNTAGDAGFIGRPVSSASNIDSFTVRQTILHDASSLGGRSGIHLRNVDSTAVAMNNIIYDIIKSTGSGDANIWGIYQNVSTLTDKTIYILNNTIHNTTNEGSGSGSVEGLHVAADGAEHNFKNNLITDTNGDNSGTIADYDASIIDTTNMTTNASSDSTAPSPIAAEPVVSSAEFISTTGSSENLHLKDDAESLDAGTDLGTTPAGVEIDIDNRDRDANADTWDIGADECDTCTISAAVTERIEIILRGVQIILRGANINIK